MRSSRGLLAALRIASNYSASTSGAGRTIATTSSSLSGVETRAEMDYTVETINALTRTDSGRLAAKRWRKEGRLPAIVFSLPGETAQLITLDRKVADRMVSTYGRSGFTSRLLNLTVEDADSKQSKTYPVLPRLVHRTAASRALENITFLYCPKDRVVSADIPVKILGEDVSPGVKKGGFVAMIKRRIKCKCKGDSIPASLEVDVSSLDMGEKVGLGTLTLPDGVVLAEKHLEEPICKIAGKAARD